MADFLELGRQITVVAVRQSAKAEVKGTIEFVEGNAHKLKTWHR